MVCPWSENTLLLLLYLFVSWSTSDLRSQCHLTLTNTGRRELKGSASVRQAVYEARSGIVGGHIEIQELKFRGTRKYHSKHFFIFIGRECTAWPANNCLQIIACSCVVPSKCVFVANDIPLMRNCNCSITSKKLFNSDQWKIKQNSYIYLIRKLSDSATRRIQAAVNFFTVRLMSLTQFVILFDVFQPISTKSVAVILSTWPIWACGMPRHVLITWELVYWWETYLHSRQTCAMSGHCRKRRALLPVSYSRFLYFV